MEDFQTTNAPEQSGTKLFIGNLSWSTTNESLRKAFETCSTVVDAVVMKDKFSGRSRGFGFVTVSPESADKAVSTMNGYVLDGRDIRVDKATERDPNAPRPPRKDFGGSRGGFNSGGRSGGYNNDRGGDRNYGRPY